MDPLEKLMDTGEISAPWQGSERGRIEVSRRGEDHDDSTAILGKIHRRLRRMDVFPSACFEDDYPFTVGGTEMAVKDLAREFESAYSKIRNLEGALQSKGEECKLLKNFNDPLSDKIKGFEEKMLLERAAWEQEYGERIKRIQQSHQREKEHLENEKMLQEKQHREKVAMIENAAKDDALRMKRDFDNQIFRAHEEIHKKDQEIEEVKKKQEVKEKRMEEQYAAEKSRVGKEREEEHRNLRDEVEALRGAIVKRDHVDNETILLEKQHREKVAMIESAAKEDVMKMKTYFDNQIFRAEESLRISTEHHVTVQAAKDEMMKRFKEENAAMKQDLQLLHKAIHKKDQEIEEVKKKQEVKEKRMEEQYAAGKLILEKEREEERRGLRGEVEALKGAMVKRDHFKFKPMMSGRELALRFQDLASEIDDFSRVRWDNRQETTWPFPDKVFRNSENERRSKQYVIQNTIWVILYERIFCTPFRVLGTEGKLMEQDWIEKYGKGELPHPDCLIRQLSSTRFEISGGPCALSKAYQSF
jgi:hypothetical protein